MALAAPLLEGLTAILAVALLGLAPALTSRRAILLTQIGASVAFACHGLLLNVPHVALVQLLAITQIIAALLAPVDRRMERIGYALILLMMLGSVLTWQGSVSALSLPGIALIALARMQHREMRLRLLMLAGCCVWVAHGALDGAGVTLTANLLALATGLFGLARLGFRQRHRRRRVLLPHIHPTAAMRPVPLGPQVAPKPRRAA